MPAIRVIFNYAFLDQFLVFVIRYPPHHPLGVGGAIYNNHTLESF